MLMHFFFTSREGVFDVNSFVSSLKKDMRSKEINPKTMWHSVPSAHSITQRGELQSCP